MISYDVLPRKSLCSLIAAVILVSMGCGDAGQTDDVLIDLDELTVSKIHAAYQSGEFNCEQLVTAYLQRIDQFDSRINAITVINQSALAIARDLDSEFATTSELRPLHGVPLIVKDNINTKGMPTTAGALALKDFVPDSDAFVIQKLVEAGAVVLAKSNMAEWAFSPRHTESSTAGITRNPYNLSHVPAGSSGGSAAAIAANFGAISLGTDTGNSIRGPSSHNALVGFRSTLGLASRHGIVPLYLRNDVVGPMCRTVEDAVKVLDVIAVPDPKDPMTLYSAGKKMDSYLQYLKKDGLKGARIGILRVLSDEDVDQEIHALFERAIQDMQTVGAVIVDPVVVPAFDSLRRNQWCREFRKDVEAFLAEFVKEDTLVTLEDIVRVGTSSDYAAARLQYFLDNSGRSDDAGIVCLDPYTDERRIAFRFAIETVMDSLELDALVYPSWNHQPAKIDSFNAGYKGDNSQVIAPHTGQPAFTIPMGFTSGSLPAGLQFLGRMYDEPTLIRLTYAYEQATRHRRPPQVD